MSNYGKGEDSVCVGHYRPCDPILKNSWNHTVNCKFQLYHILSVRSLK